MYLKDSEVLRSTLRSTIRQYWDNSISAQENEVARENVDCLLRGVTFSKCTETNNNKESLYVRPGSSVELHMRQTKLSELSS